MTDARTMDVNFFSRSASDSKEKRTEQNRTEHKGRQSKNKKNQHKLKKNRTKQNKTNQNNWKQHQKSLIVVQNEVKNVLKRIVPLCILAPRIK